MAANSAQTALERCGMASVGTVADQATKETTFCLFTLLLCTVATELCVSRSRL